MAERAALALALAAALALLALPAARVEGATTVYTASQYVEVFDFSDGDRVRVYPDPVEIRFPIPLSFQNATASSVQAEVRPEPRPAFIPGLGYASVSVSLRVGGVVSNSTTVGNETVSGSASFIEAVVIVSLYLPSTVSGVVDLGSLLVQYSFGGSNPVVVVRAQLSTGYYEGEYVLALSEVKAYFKSAEVYISSVDLEGYRFEASPAAATLSPVYSVLVCGRADADYYAVIRVASASGGFSEALLRLSKEQSCARLGGVQLAPSNSTQVRVYVVSGAFSFEASRNVSALGYVVSVSAPTATATLTYSGLLKGAWEVKVYYTVQVAGYYPTPREVSVSAVAAAGGQYFACDTVTPQGPGVYQGTCNVVAPSGFDPLVNRVAVRYSVRDELGNTYSAEYQAAVLVVDPTGVGGLVASAYTMTITAMVVGAAAVAALSFLSSLFPGISRYLSVEDAAGASTVLAVLLLVFGAGIPAYYYYFSQAMSSLPGVSSYAPQLSPGPPWSVASQMVGLSDSLYSAIMSDLNRFVISKVNEILTGAMVLMGIAMAILAVAAFTSLIPIGQSLGQVVGSLGGGILSMVLTILLTTMLQIPLAIGVAVAAVVSKILIGVATVAALAAGVVGGFLATFGERYTYGVGATLLGASILYFLAVPPTVYLLYALYKYMVEQVLNTAISAVPPMGASVLGAYIGIPAQPLATIVIYSTIAGAIAVSVAAAAVVVLTRLGIATSLAEALLSIGRR